VVNLLPRRRSDAATAEAVVASPDVVALPSGTPGKGRPTPKRRDSAAVRGPVHAPQTRKEAYARQRQLAKQERSTQRAAGAARRNATARGGTGSRTTIAEQRAALRAGDPAALPRRDQGATRKLARDWVDSHRLISNYLLVLLPLMIAGYVIPGASVVVLALFVVAILEWYISGRRIRRLAVARFGTDDGGGAMALGFYVGSRAFMPRRWRLPAPQVERGDEI
jgi:hypothetical protein